MIQEEYYPSSESKALYCINTSVYLSLINKKDVIRLYDRDVWSLTQWHYGELPSYVSKTYTDFQETVKNVNAYITSDKTVFTHKSFIWCKTAKKYIKVFEKDFQCLRVEYEPEILPIEQFTIETLSKRLKSNEFIDFCKDYGLGVNING